MASNRLWGNREEKIVILDSSAIMMCFEFSIDLENELTRLLGKYHIIIPGPIVEELEFLAKNGRGKKKLMAKPALDLIKRYDIINLNTCKKGDNAVIHFARELSGIVLTNDHFLKKRLQELFIKIIYLRGKKRLVLE
jgi:rRNA-processing protein FCF1